jgi:hypothetical protein
MAMLGEERFRRVLVIGSHWSFSDYSEDLDYSEDSDYSVNMNFRQRYKKNEGTTKKHRLFSDAAMK